MAAAKANVSVAWHLEPYPGRSAASVAEDVRYIEATYGCAACESEVPSRDACPHQLSATVTVMGMITP